MPRQLIFELPVRSALGRVDFFVSPANARAVASLDAPEDWPERKLILAGPEGSGKTHLVHVWAATHGARILDAGDLARMEPTAAQALVVEDADRIAGDRAAETALFHLHNLVLADGGYLLITTRQAPRQVGFALPDLASRMEASPLVTLDPPDDALLAAVLVKLFADRQITVPMSLIPWLVGRMDRSFAAAHRIVADIDALALATGRPIGRKIAAEVLDSARHDAQ
ncbi:MAG: chromosomal replication initiator DnaA [Rhodobacteraceae bacterium]|nr:chromosomal replication initiator DnaA [Paracoccaceae bacterium]